MKALLLKTGIVALFISLSFSVKAHVALDYPHGGETFIVGETVTIQWQVLVQHVTLNWDVYFSSDSGMTWDTLQLDISTSQLSYNWVIPDLNISTGRVRVIQDNLDQDYLDISMDFIIAPNTDPPLLDAPAVDTIIECNIANQEVAIQAWLNNHGGASATNHCGELIWTHDYPGLSNGCGATGSALVTFTAVDDCGMITTTATLTVADTYAPNITMNPMDLTVQSDGQGNTGDLNNWLNANAGAAASDGCSNVLWTNNYSGLSDGCGWTGSATVIFTVTDECGNSSNTSASFSIEDHFSPIFLRLAEDTTIECNTSNQQDQIQHWLELHGGAAASDDSGEVVWSQNYTSLSDGCGSSGMANVIFSAVDPCGNGNTTTATLYIQDTVGPVIDHEAHDTIIQCGLNNSIISVADWLNHNGGASASDLCGNVLWTNDFGVVPDTCGPMGSYSVLFTATDECGNANTTHATLMIMDSIVTATQLPQGPGFNLYPNPSSDIITISFEEGMIDDINIRLLDVDGKIVWSEQDKAFEITIPVYNYPPGIYFLQILTASGSSLRKVMIN